MKSLASLAAATLAFASLGAYAGGPLSVCNDAGKTPLKYSPPTVNLNYDLGNLGSRTKAQADAIIGNAVALWTNVGTANITIGRGADLPVDVTSTNYLNYIGSNTYNDGLNPVVYDTDGSIVDLLLGTNAKNNVLGFAGSAYYLAPTCRMAEGRAVISGFLSIDDTTMSVVMAHEIGHLIGMDHTQLDSTQGLSPAFGSSNYPLMYPIAYRDFVSLQDDDAAAVSALYPDPTLNSVYGQISGTFVQANGVTPVLGANLWATETTTNKVYSIVSDYLTQGSGYFKLLLPAGTYNLRAEAIDSQFTGGSSVGPYSEDSLQPSFQAPLYSGATPMPIVTLGGGTPTAFTITAGCAATLTFGINGTGTIGGNCGAPTPASMVTPAPGTTLAGSSQTFTWNNASATLYQVAVGTSVGASNLGLFPAAGTAGTSTTVTGLPTDGRTLYVRLYSQFSGTWYSRDYTYTAAVTQASMVSPANATALTGTSQTFTWNNAGASLYQVAVGTSVGASNVGLFPAAGTASTSTTVTGLPTDGRTLYVRLYSNFGGIWYSRDYTYTATVVSAAMASPAPGTTFVGASQTFTWTNAGASLYQVAVGSVVGGSDLGLFPAAGTASTSTIVTGIPVDGRTMFVRLYSNFAGTWYSRDYSYTTFNATGAIPAAMLVPAPGATLAGSSQTFTWGDVGASLYQVWIGNSPGAYDLGFYPAAGTTSTSTTVSGLPTDGRMLYVRVYSVIGGQWYPRDFKYVASSPIPGVASAALLAGPVPGTTLSNETQTFTWNNSGASLYRISLGTTPGSNNLGDFPDTGGTSATAITIDRLPINGNPLYVRLSSFIAGAWVPLDFSYNTAAPAVATPAVMLTPASGSTLSGPNRTFTWSNSGASQYQVWVGNALGARDIGIYPAGGTTGTSTTIGGLPTDGRTLYVRLYSYINGTWYPRDYSYTSGP